MTRGGQAKKAVGYGAFPLVVLALINGVQTAEPAGISYATQGIENHFHVGDAIVGFMPLAASLIGIPAILTVGPLADRVHRVRLIAILLGLWAAALGVAALAPFFALLFVSRSFVGALESNQPAGLSLLADYYPVNRRGKVMSQFQLGGAIGGGFGAVFGPLTDLFGFRVVFWAWVPVGIGLALLTLRLPDTVRGQQDSLVQADALPLVGAIEVEDPLHLPAPVQRTLIDHLPEPVRVGTCDYGHLSKRELMVQLRSIHSMWFGVLSITVAQVLLNALAFWSPKYFEKFHHLSGSGAAGIQSILGLGSILGILLGGIISDRLMAKGNLNGRITVIVVGSLGATAALAPAFVMHDLLLATPLFFVGGFFITLPIGPAEAMLQDVVVAELRGRANSVRSVVRAGSAVGPTIVGLLSHFVGIAAALSLLTPIYALGGLIVLKARRSYPTDLAYVFAEARRTGGGNHPR